VHLRQHVESIDCDADAKRIVGVTLRRNGKRIRARDGVICNAPAWLLQSLIKDDRIKAVLNGGQPYDQPMSIKPPTSWTTTSEGSYIHWTRPTTNETDLIDTNLLARCDSAEMTASFMHLHLVVNATGLNLDALEAHYTVMDRSLSMVCRMVRAALAI
jgi:hypothetical protein